MKRFETLKALTKEIDGVKNPLKMLAFFKVWNLIFALSPLFVYSYFVNNVLVNKNINDMWLVLMGYLTIYLFATAGVVYSKKFSYLLTLRYDLKIKNKLLKKYMSLLNPIYSIGDAKSRVETDSEVAENFFINHILEFTYSVVYSVLLAIILLVYDWKIAAISFVFIPVAFFTVKVLGDKTKKTGEELWEIQTKYENFLHFTFQNWKDIKINNLEESQVKDLNSQFKKIKHVWFWNHLYLHIGTTFSFFTQNFITQLFILLEVCLS